eukprot:1580401-Pyramimonas_sp.AAC.1
MPPPLPRDPKPRSTNNVDRDSTVRGTNDDATVSKLYASKLMNLCLLHILSLVSASRGSLISYCTTLQSKTFLKRQP